jgi:hypothetical protein
MHDLFGFLLQFLVFLAPGTYFMFRNCTPVFYDVSNEADAENRIALFLR